MSGAAPGGPRSPSRGPWHRGGPVEVTAPRVDNSAEWSAMETVSSMVGPGLGLGLGLGLPLSPVL